MKLLMIKNLLFTFMVVNYFTFSLALDRPKLYPNLVDIVTIDLDLPPAQRWNPKIHNNFVTKACSILKAYQRDFIGTIISSTFGGDESKYNLFLNSIKESLPYTPEDFQAEIKSISDVCGIDEDYVIIINYTYESNNFQGCTSIPIKFKDGSVSLMSNLDYSMPDLIAHLYFHAIYKKNGDILFEGGQVFGTLGPLRSHKKGVYAISMNQRSHKEPIENYRQHIISGQPYVTNLFIMRYVNERAETYAEAIELYKKTQTFSNSYLTLVNFENPDGIIIQKDVQEAETKTFTFGDDNWYLVQTNADRHKIKDTRRRIAEEKLDTMTREYASIQEVFNEVLAKKPNFVFDSYYKLYRTLSSSYIDENGDFKVFLWTAVPTVDDFYAGQTKFLNEDEI